MNASTMRLLVPTLTAVILSACASQNPAPVIDGSATGTNVSGSGIYTPTGSTTTTANNNNPYGAVPYNENNTTTSNTTNVGTESYPIHTDNSIYTPNANATYTPPTASTSSSSYTGNYSPVDVNATYHTVVRGDTVYNISKRYGISQEQLRAWNNLNGDMISQGQRLRVKPQSSAANNSSANHAPAATGGTTHRVVAGDTVYNISKRYGISQEQLRQLNGISGNDIKIGQVLRLGANSSAPAYTTPVAQPAYTPPAATVATNPPPATAANQSGAAKTYQFNGITWQAPLANARVSQKFNPTTRNMQLTGPSGQPVVAVADGKVIFSGPGPRGYGNLVVIQHALEHLSAYGNNQTLAVKEFQQVKRGDIVGTLSSSGNLLFEVRKDSIPIDPTSFMQL